MWETPRKDTGCHFPRMKGPCFIVHASLCMQLWGRWTRRNWELGRAEVMGRKPGKPLTSGAGRDLVGTMDFGARMPEYKYRLFPPHTQFIYLLGCTRSLMQHAGFSYETWALELTGSIVVALGLSCPTVHGIWFP